jgi:hypothetical protein
VAKLDANQVKAKANRKKDMEEIMADSKAWREKMAAEREAWREAIRSMGFETTNTGKETMACQERQARLEEEEQTSAETKPEVAQQREVPVEDAVLKLVKGRKKRYRGKKQAAWRREEPKEMTRGIC